MATKLYRYRNLKFNPIYDRILIRRTEAPEKIGLIHLPESAKEKPIFGLVVRTGVGAVQADGKVRPICVKEGDVILFQKYSGLDIELDIGEKKPEEFVLIMEEDVLGKIG